MRRIAAGDLHVGASDKEIGMVFMTIEMSLLHTTNDENIEWKELEETQRELQAHSKVLARVFRLRKG